MVKSPWVHNHQLWLWDPWYWSAFHHPLWLRLRPKPLTPARQNNVIATAAPPATDATESSRKTILLLSDASGRETQGQTPSDLQRDFWQPEHSAMHLKPVQLMKLLSVVTESSWIFAMFVGSYPPRYFLIFPCFGAENATYPSSCMPWPWEIQGRTASGLLAGVLAQFEVIGDGIEVQTATEALVSCQIGQDVDVWNLETPNGSMFV